MNDPAARAESRCSYADARRIGNTFEFAKEIAIRQRSQ